jgi:hypothetical protein
LWERDDVRKKHPDHYWNLARRQIEAEDARDEASEPSVDISGSRSADSENAP